MVIRKPQQVITHDDNNKLLLEFIANTNMFFYTWRNSPMNPTHALHAAEFMSAQAGFEISPEQAEGILTLYPHARIKMVQYEGLDTTEVRDLVSDALAHFFLGCTWPTYGDKINAEVFCKALYRQAIEMGFTHG